MCQAAWTEEGCPAALPRMLCQDGQISLVLGDILGTLFMCVQGEGSALLLGMWLQGANACPGRNWADGAGVAPGARASPMAFLFPVPLTVADGERDGTRMRS